MHISKLLIDAIPYFALGAHPPPSNFWVCPAGLGKGVKIRHHRVRISCRVPRRVRKEVQIWPSKVRAPEEARNRKETPPPLF